MGQRIPASERTHQQLEQLLQQGIGDGDARAELIKLAVRKIVEEALEAEVSEAVGRGYYASGATPGLDTGTGIGAGGCRRPRARSSTGSRSGRSTGALRVADPGAPGRPNG